MKEVQCDNRECKHVFKVVSCLATAVCPKCKNEVKINEEKAEESGGRKG